MAFKALMVSTEFRVLVALVTLLEPVLTVSRESVALLELALEASEASMVPQVPVLPVLVKLLALELSVTSRTLLVTSRTPVLPILEVSLASTHQTLAASAVLALKTSVALPTLAFLALEA